MRLDQTTIIVEREFQEGEGSRGVEMKTKELGAMRATCEKVRLFLNNS